MGNSIAVEVPDRDKGLQWYAHVTMPSCTLNFMYSCKKGLSFDTLFCYKAQRHLLFEN